MIAVDPPPEVVDPPAPPRSAVPLAELRRRAPDLYANGYLLLALALALVYHGGLLVSGSYKHTYDAYVHLFFADHYMRAWFDHWEYRWYTGFPVISYPPGSQQSIALLAFVIGLPAAYVVIQLAAILLSTVGVFRSSRMWVSETAAGYAALIFVFGTALAETVHVWGQLPTIFALGFLLNALPFVHRWLVHGRLSMLLIAWALNAATTAGHHVTTLFGAVFFVGPVILSALIHAWHVPAAGETGPLAPLSRATLAPYTASRLRRVLPTLLRAALYGVGLVVVLLLVVLPYWLYSRADPITQVPIPHGSRDSFLVNPNAGLVFWLIPYGLTLLALPYILRRGLQRHLLPLWLSWALLFVLGTGGTTPIPRWLLGGAYNILTLDRFTFWATIIALPLVAEAVVSLHNGAIARYLRDQWGPAVLHLLQGGLVVAYLIASLATANLTQLRHFQPDPIEMQPLVDFLAKDQHDRWRYLTLGFGDQFAWLSAQTTATSVDGDYHSARRLPELTSAPVERLEGAKYRGTAGIRSLQQFLAVPEKYQLKYVFSNDQFYDPLLFFSGWHRLQRLTNGVMVWERADIPPLPSVLPRVEIPNFQRIMWGVVPLAAVLLGLLALGARWWLKLFPRSLALTRRGPSSVDAQVQRLWSAVDRRLARWSATPNGPSTAGPAHRPVPRPRRWSYPPPASQPLRRRRVHWLLVGATLLTLGSFGWYVTWTNTPLSLVARYFNDLDFGRYQQAYALLDPATRPSFDLYRLQLSVENGLVASYGKLSDLHSRVVSGDAQHLVVDVNGTWMTALQPFPAARRLKLVRHGWRWSIEAPPQDLSTPPDEFFRRPSVTFGAQGRRQLGIGPVPQSDLQDRPNIRVLESRLVRSGNNNVAVGELINDGVDPADVTLTAFLYDANNRLISSANAQTAILHKLLPQETTPFRIDLPPAMPAAAGSTAVPRMPLGPPAALQVYARGVVTGRDLYRDLAAQYLRVGPATDRSLHLFGQLLNIGTGESVVPHLLITYYDVGGHVAWVDERFLGSAIRPQRSAAWDLPLPDPTQISFVLEGSRLPGELLTSQRVLGASTDRLLMPPASGFAAARITVNDMTGAAP
ncbi:MAG: hypothetical protein NVS2B7_18980 [Herpetosiphon sp.]